MCLVGIAWRNHPRYPLVVAGNRDEFHERPSAAAAWWDDADHVLGGRDLVASGSWLAVNRRGRFAVVVNRPGRPPDPEHSTSRGQLVRDYVVGEKPAGRYLDAVQAHESRYAGFCLVIGTRVQLRALVSPRGEHAGRWTLRPGITVLTNSPLETPTPKAGYLDSAMRGLLGAGEVDCEDLLAVLARRDAVDGDGPVLSRTPFIVGERYGTRASTVVMMDAHGLCRFEERRFDASGQPTGSTREQFEING